MADVGYINEEVRKMYGIPLSKLTSAQRKILKEDGVRRSKLIAERQKAFMQNNQRAFQDAEQMNSVLTKLYKNCQKSILADVSETIAAVKKSGGEWSYANASKITRSRGLFEQINKELVQLGTDENVYFRTSLQNIYTDQFLRTIYTLGQTNSLTGTGSFNMLNTRLVQTALDYPWSGAMFSDRLWTDKERLGRNIRLSLTQSMILGEDMDKISDRIAAGLDTSKYNAMRIARTETKRVTYAAQVEAFKEQGVEEVRYMAANNGGDSRTCALCKGDHNTVYKLGEEPTLPRHPNCRCWYVPVVSDEFGDDELNELTGSVRGSENYDKWKEAQEEKIAAVDAQDTKTPRQLITEKVEADAQQYKDQRQAISMQIDTLQAECDDIPSQYAEQLTALETQKSQANAVLYTRTDEIETLRSEQKAIRTQRSDYFSQWEQGLITEKEYDLKADELLSQKIKISEVITQKQDELSAAYKTIREADEEIEKIQKEIATKQTEIKLKMSSLSDEAKEILVKELDLQLDIDYVGDSLERYESLDTFRAMRTALRENDTFDFDTYKSELVKMAQRMDDDAVVIEKALAEKTKVNLYNFTSSGAAYYPSESRVKMSMSANSHEKALGNGLKGSWQTKAHEEGHQLDALLGSVSDFSEVVTPSAQSWAYLGDFTNCGTVSGQAMSKAIESDLLSYLNKAIEYSNASEGCEYKVLKSMSRISNDARFASARYYKYLTSDKADDKMMCQLGALSDAMGLFTKDKIGRNAHMGGWGHDSSYNKARGKAGANSETWATFCAIRIYGSTEEQEVFKEFMPETWSCMDGIFHKLATYLSNGGKI